MLTKRAHRGPLNLPAFPAHTSLTGIKATSFTPESTLVSSFHLHLRGFVYLLQVFGLYAIRMFNNSCVCLSDKHSCT